MDELRNDDGPPFEGSAPVLALEIRAVAGTSQGFNVGAALWQRRKDQTADDARPAAEKAKAPAYTMEVFEFLDGAEFLNLDSLLVRAKPRWAFLNPTQDAASKLKVEEVLSRAGADSCEPSYSADKAFKWPHGSTPNDKERRREREQELAAALDAPNLNSHVEVMALKLGLDALHCVLSELRPLGLLDPDQSTGSMDEDDDDETTTGSLGEAASAAMMRERPCTFHALKLGRLDGCMRLDSAAADAVMLLPDKRLAARTPHGSLFDVLNHCGTRMGSRLLEAWLRQPLVDVAAIGRRHDIVGGFKDHAGLRGDLKEAIKNAPDLDAVVVKLRRTLAKMNAASSDGAKKGGGSGGRAGGRAATLADVYKLYCFAVRNLPAFQAAIDAWLDENDAATGDGGGGDDSTSSSLSSSSFSSSSSSSSSSSGGVAASLRTRFADPLRQCANDLTAFKQLVEHVLDFEALPDDLRIKPQHSPALTELAQDLETVAGRVAEIHENIQDEWKGVRSGAKGKSSEVRLEKHKEEGYVMRLPSASDEQLLRKEVPDVEILGILKNGVVFTTEELRCAAAESIGLNDQYALEQAAVADKVVATAATYAPVVESAARCVAELDVLLSFAHAAAHCPGGEYVRPTFVSNSGGAAPAAEDGAADDTDATDATDGTDGAAAATGGGGSGGGARIKLLGARHPCVELQDGVAFIPNDYDFERDSSRFQIVTGPNMGGKSTFIRGLGSLVVMAQVGSFVPCDAGGAELPLVDAVLARVGAGDYAARGLSTFMAEMLEASTIVRTATANSLVIIDELGRGTSTFDGFGLAWAISQFMVSQIRCWTLFATHFHELTTLAESEQAVVNKHVSAFVDSSSDEVTFLYEVQDGPCLQSYGTHVARMAHFPKAVVDVAVAKAKKLEDTSNLDPSLKNKRKKGAAGSSSGAEQQQQQQQEEEGTPQKLVKLMRAVKDLPLKTLAHPQRVEGVQKAAAAAGLV